MNSSSLALLVVMGVLAAFSVKGSEPASMGPFFSQPATSIPQLVAQQEIQRRYADIMLGLSQSSHWQQYAAIEARKFAMVSGEGSSSPLPAAVLEEDDNNVADDDDDDVDDDVSLLELKSEAPSPFGSLLSPFLGDKTKLGRLTISQLEDKSTASKVSALKHLQVQLYLVSSDVEKTYWVNKILTPLLPQQLMYFKLYKQYLTTTALSLAYQLHDSFTLEAILDNFNDKFSGAKKSDVSEARAEFHVYSQWYQLASIKIQLYYLSLYEQSMMTRIQSMASGTAFQSFLEVEEGLKAEPAAPFVGAGDSASNAQQYQFVSQYVNFFRMYIMYSELSLSQAGLMAAQNKQQGLEFKYDDKADNDVEGFKLLKQASEIEGKYLPTMYGQWAQLTTMKFYLEFSKLYQEMQNPQIALANAPQRAESALQDMNLMQTEATTTTA